MEDQTFPVTINDRRIRVTYKKDGMHHVYSSPISFSQNMPNISLQMNGVAAS